LNAKGITPFVFPGNESHWFRYIIQVWWAQYQGAYEENTLNVAEGAGTFYDYWNMSDAEVLKQKGIQVGIDTAQSLFVDMNAKAWKNSLENVNSYYVKDAEKAFVEGKAAMLLGASFMYSEVEKYMQDGVVYKMMNMPTIANAQQKADGTAMNMNYYTSEDFMIVPKQATNKDLAKEFLAYLCNEKYLLDFTSKTGTLRPFKLDDSVLDAGKLGLNAFNASVLEVYKTSDVRLASLPANVKALEDRSLVALYNETQINGEMDWASFASKMK
jgi:spermidine/putrescine-binding protein